MKTGKEIQFKTRPLLFAAWPGIGNAGLLAVNYLRMKLGTSPLATIDMASMVSPHSIAIRNGMVGSPLMPENTFYYREDPDIILFESDTQFTGKEGVFMINALLEVARQFNVARIFTIDGIHEPLGDAKLTGLFCASNNDDLLSALEQIGIKPMHEGNIHGLSGILTGMAKAQNIEAACLLTPIPTYAESIPYPRAALEIVRVIRDLIGVSVDLSDITESVKKMDKFLRMAKFDNNENEIISDREEEVQDSGIASANSEVIEKIDKLFDEVRTDRSKAGELKKELDRWNLFSLYERKFLDLFRRDKGESL